MFHFLPREITAIVVPPINDVRCHPLKLLDLTHFSRSRKNSSPIDHCNSTLDPNKNNKQNNTVLSKDLSSKDMLAIFPVTQQQITRRSLSPSIMAPNQTSLIEASLYPPSPPSLCHHDDELESFFQNQFQQGGPSFQLSSWSSGSSAEATTTTSTTTTTAHSRSTKTGISLPFANVDDDTPDTDDDDDDDGSMSCDWSMESSFDDDDDDDENVVTEAPQREAEKILEDQPRRVRFSDCIYVRTFQKAATEDQPQLYYTAHELQKIIDEYILEQRHAAALICPANTGNQPLATDAP